MKTMRRDEKKEMKKLWFVVMIAGMIWLTGCTTKDKILMKKIITEDRNVVKIKKMREVKAKIETEKVFSVKWGKNTNQIQIGIYTNDNKVEYYGPTVFAIDKSGNYYITDYRDDKVIKFSNNKVVAKYDYSEKLFAVHEILIDSNNNKLLLYCPKTYVYKFSLDGRSKDYYVSLGEEYGKIFRNITNKQNDIIKIEYLKKLNWKESWKEKYNYKYKILT